MTAAEIRDDHGATHKAFSRLMESNADHPVLQTALLARACDLLAEIAAQLAEMNARGGVFEFAGEVFNRSHIAVVNKAIESQFDVYLVGHSEATFNFIERPGATHEDFVRAWKGE